MQTDVMSSLQGAAFWKVYCSLRTRSLSVSGVACEWSYAESQRVAFAKGLIGVPGGASAASSTYSPSVRRERQ